MDGRKDPIQPHFAGRKALCQYILDHHEDFADSGTLFVIDLSRYSQMALAMAIEDMNRLMAEIHQQLRSVAHDHGEVFRVDSSLFGILWRATLNKGQSVLACTRILRELRNLPFCRHAALEIGPQIGVAALEPGLTTARDWVNASYLALALSNEDYPQYVIFEPGMLDTAHRNWHLQRELSRAVERQEFRLHYQPRVDLQSGRCLGVEALLRWHCPGLGDLSPGEFIPVMENSGLITDVTDWVFRRGAYELATWLKEDRSRDFAFNISARVLMEPEFGEAVKQSIGL